MPLIVTVLTQSDKIGSRSCTTSIQWDYVMNLITGFTTQLTVDTRTALSTISIEDLFTNVPPRDLCVSI